MAKNRPHLKFTDADSAEARKESKLTEHTGPKRRTPARKKLKTDAEKAAEKAAQLRHGKAEVTVDELSRMTKEQRRALYAAAAAAAASTVQGATADNREDEPNTGAEVLEEGGKTAQKIAGRRKKKPKKGADSSIETRSGSAPAPERKPEGAEAAKNPYGGKLKANSRAGRLYRQNAEASPFSAYQAEDGGSNGFSRWKQKADIRKGYAAARHGTGAGSTAATGRNAASGGTSAADLMTRVADEMKNLGSQVVVYASNHAHFLVAGLALAALLMILMSFFSSCTVLMSGGSNVVTATSFTADDKDIVDANNDYTQLEKELRERVDRIPSENPGYDEYKWHLDEIGHDPYVLLAYLTVKHEDFKRRDVQLTLRELLEKQYKITLVPEVQIRTRYIPVPVLNPISGITVVWVEEQYEYRILHITLKNNGLENVVKRDMNEDEREHYQTMLETKGNKSYLFGDDIYSNPTGPTGTYEDYKIPGEALTDEKFASMIEEAQKYLGMPYVWGGSSPSTSFDCSGFVSWVINHSDLGLQVGRQTANGLLKLCARVSASEAQPGDLVFFEKTYDTIGASHVGIYVGNNMMIHCGNPISYTSITKSYWQEHFLCFGRLPEGG